MMAISDAQGKKMYINEDFVSRPSKQFEVVSKFLTKVPFEKNGIESKEMKFCELPVEMQTITVSTEQFEFLIELSKQWGKPIKNIDGKQYLQAIDQYGFNITGLRASKNYITNVIKFTSRDDENRNYTFEDLVGILVKY